LHAACFLLGLAALVDLMLMISELLHNLISPFFTWEGLFTYGCYINC